MSNLSKICCTVAIFAGLALATIGSSASASMIGGVAAAHAGGGSGCQDTHSVPLTTVQNSMALSASVGCLTESASVDMYADAATASLGVQASAIPNAALGTQANALVGLIDRWIFTLPAGVATGAMLSIPVSFTLDGNITPLSSYRSSYERFMDYGFSILDLGNTTSQFSRYGRITAPGVYSNVFSGVINLINGGPGLGMMAEIDMSLNIPGLEVGLIDFYHTARISLDLPDGVSVATASGLPLDFGSHIVPDPVSLPEPASWMLLMIGLAGVVSHTRRMNANR